MALTYTITFNSGEAEEWSVSNGNEVAFIKVTKTINSKYQSALISVRTNDNTPEIGDTVLIQINSTTIFNGYVSRTQESIAGIRTWEIQLIGKTYDLWRERIDGTGQSSHSNNYTSYMISSMVADYTSLTFPQADNIGQMLNGEYNFLDMSVGDAVTKVSGFDNYYFYVNESDELIYYQPGTTQMTITEADLLSRKPFEKSDDEVYNSIVVRGSAGISGTAEDATSISTYGKHFLRVNEPIITNEDDVQALADSYLTEYKDPKLQGTITIVGDESIDIGRKITFDLTHHDITGEHDIVAYTHIIDKKGYRTEIQFGREPYEPAKEFDFLRKSDSNAHYGAFKAIADAASAEAAADGAVESYFQCGPPDNPSSGDLWYISCSGNKPYRYNGTNWISAQDQDISWAMASAANARSIADGKIRTFYQDTVPASANVSYGDIWFETDATSDENALWFASEDYISTKGEWQTASDFRADWSKINDDGGKPDDNATVNDVIKQDTEPPCDATKTNNFWIDDSDSDNLVVYICDGTNWQRSSRKIFRGSNEPTGGNYVDGDLWVDSSTQMVFQYDTTAADWILASQHVNKVTDVSDIASPKDEMLVWGMNGSEGPALWEYDTSDSSWHNASVTTADEVNAEAQVHWGTSPPSSENAWWVDTSGSNDVLKRYNDSTSSWEVKAAKHLAELDGDASNITETDIRKWAAENGADITSGHAYDITGTVTTYGNLPTCNSDRNGYIYRVSDEERCYRCNSSSWQKMGDVTSDHQNDVYIYNLGNKDHDELDTILADDHHGDAVASDSSVTMAQDWLSSGVDSYYTGGWNSSSSVDRIIVCKFNLFDWRSNLTGNMYGRIDITNDGGSTEIQIGQQILPLTEDLDDFNWIVQTISVYVPAGYQWRGYANWRVEGTGSTTPVMYLYYMQMEMNTP